MCNYHDFVKNLHPKVASNLFEVPKQLIVNFKHCDIQERIKEDMKALGQDWQGYNDKTW